MGRTRLVRTLVSALLALGLAVGAAPTGAGADGRWHRPPPTLLPIVFVHGQFGSAQQLQSQAMRFTSNGYPQDLLFAFEYDTSQPTNPIGALDAFVDEVLAETGAPQVLAIGHSRGTSVWTTYLGTGGAAKVAKYVNIDGASPSALPGGVPTIGIWGEWNSAGSPYNRRGGTDAQIGPDPAANFHYPDRSHTEVATSPEAFARMYEFFTGRPPRTTDVTTSRWPWVSVAGRAVLFPENVGYPGAKVQVWRVDGRTGRRIWRWPSYQTTVDASGAWGPVWLSTHADYELTIVSPDGLHTHHFYQERFLHDDHFVRLQTGLPGGLLDLVTPDSDETTNLVILRMKELWGDQGSGSDRILIDGTDVVLPATSPRSGVNLALFVHDDGLDGVTDLGKGELPPFDSLPFLAAVDVSIPATPGGTGTVRVAEVPRGGGDPAVVNVPRWPSTDHLVSIQLRDHEQPDRRGPHG